MHDFFDVINAYLLHHPAILGQLRWLFWFKSWCLFLVMGVYLFLVYREDWRRRAASRKVDERLIA
ncbi:MAG: hypothetical protein EPN21_12825 [Methylococcaceae bacterium]|nr:MAG: hypothetical protein EPN21_12825 [Methylococcaceae bacterium]